MWVFVPIPGGSFRGSSECGRFLLFTKGWLGDFPLRYPSRALYHRTMRRSSPLVLKLLALYYLIQGLLLTALGSGGLFLLDHDRLLVIEQWLHVIHVDPGNRAIHGLLTKFTPISDQLLETVSIGSFVYGALAFIQGGGLLFARPWASYLTVVVIGSFIPWELYGLLHHVTPLRLVTLGINGMIAWYLLARELRARRVKKDGDGGEDGRR